PGASGSTPLRWKDFARLEAARKAKKLDSIPIYIDEIDDDAMLRLMTDENATQAGNNAGAVINEIGAVTRRLIEGLRDQPANCPADVAKAFDKAGWVRNQPPSLVVAASRVGFSRIMKGASPEGAPWVWTPAFGQQRDRTPTHGYAATREAAMVAFAKSWGGNSGWNLLEREDDTLVAWYRSIYAPRTGGAYDSHHRTAGIAGCT